MGVAIYEHVEIGAFVDQLSKRIRIDRSPCRLNQKPLARREPSLLIAAGGLAIDSGAHNRSGRYAPTTRFSFEPFSLSR